MLTFKLVGSFYAYTEHMYISKIPDDDSRARIVFEITLGRRSYVVSKGHWASDGVSIDLFEYLDDYRKVTQNQIDTLKLLEGISDEYANMILLACHLFNTRDSWRHDVKEMEKEGYKFMKTLTWR